MNAGASALAIRGGVVVNDTWSGPATVIVDDGRIAAIHDPGSEVPPVGQIIDAEGMLILPGGVDPHCHVQNRVRGFATRDNYAQASEAALRGGTTTIVDFAVPTPEESPIDAVHRRLKQMEIAQADVGLHGCVINWTPEVPAQLREMASLGIRTVKLYTTYRDVLMASPETIMRAMESIAELGGMAYIHAESNHLVETAQEQQSEKSVLDVRHHPASRPEITELAAVHEILAIAEMLGSHVYLVHQSTGAAVRAITRARERGVYAYSETCPHYLVLSDEVYEGELPQRYVCCPPLRPVATVEQLRELSFNHEIHTVGSDHSCYDLAQKSQSSDARKMPNGLPGVETRMPILFSELVHARGLRPESLVRMACANPARLNGMYPRKGVIAVGSDADLVVFDPDDSRILSAGDLHMQTDYDPYEGRTVTGWPRMVIAGGDVVFDKDGFHPRSGKFIEADPFAGDRLIC